MVEIRSPVKYLKIVYTYRDHRLARSSAEREIRGFKNVVGYLDISRHQLLTFEAVLVTGVGGHVLVDGKYQDLNGVETLLIICKTKYEN